VDRGSSFAFLGELGFGYVIRFRGNIHVTDVDGQTRPAAEWVGKGGRTRKLRDARVTAQGRQVGAVVPTWKVQRRNGENTLPDLVSSGTADSFQAAKAAAVHVAEASNMV